MQTRIKVLMADDEPEVLEIMAKRVAREGYVVVTAKDGEEAWAKIQQEDPDVILLDLMMPKMDGMAVLQNLRHSPPTDKWQPVIIVSARDEFDDVQHGFSLQADHYLTKPCQAVEVVRAIKAMIKLIPQHRTSEEAPDEEPPSS